MSTVENNARPLPWLTISRCLSIATVAVVAVLFVTAGALVQAHQLLDVHGAAAIVLHVLTAALTFALLALARQRMAPWWPAALAFALFAYSFVQAYLGSGMTIGVHIPGALLVAGSSIWLLCWLFGRRAEPTSAGMSAPGEGGGRAG